MKKISESILRKFINDNKGLKAPQIVATRLPIVSIRDVSNGKVKVKGYFGKINPLVKKSKTKLHLEIYERVIKDDCSSIKSIWFNKPGIINMNTRNEYVFVGEVKTNYRGDKALYNPKFTTVQDYNEWEAKLLLYSSEINICAES